MQHVVEESIIDDTDYVIDFEPDLLAIPENSVKDLATTIIEWVKELYREGKYFALACFFIACFCCVAGVVFSFWIFINQCSQCCGRLKCCFSPTTKQVHSNTEKLLIGNAASNRQFKRHNAEILRIKSHLGLSDQDTEPSCPPAYENGDQEKVVDREDSRTETIADEIYQQPFPHLEDDEENGGRKKMIDREDRRTEIADEIYPFLHQEYDEETPHHIITECPSQAHRRYDHFGSYFVFSLHNGRPLK